MLSSHGRELNYIRISVTEQCNFRCRYCVPEPKYEASERFAAGDTRRILTWDDIFFLVGALSDLGVRKIRLTGGEPLLRPDIAPFLKKITSDFPNISFALTTNGSLLERYAERLAKTRLSGINVSLNTLDEKKFENITRGASLGAVLRGIDALRANSDIKPNIKPNIKLNIVLLRGFNDGEIPELLSYAWRGNITPRLIEFMPLGAMWREELFISRDEVIASLGGEWVKDEARGDADAGPAIYYRSRSSGRRIGVISAMSEHFCSNCNRLRVTAEGDVKSCLFRSAEVSVAESLRARDMEAVKRNILHAAAMKPAVGMETDNNCTREEKPMRMIGG
jgi:cyclic pyranopterin phosphate synthase